MTLDRDVRDWWVLHFTHMDNLSGVVAEGRLLCDSLVQGRRLQAEVGDPSIKENRRQRPVPLGAGGTVGDYVPFYFAPRSPMMYRIACDCRDSSPGRYQGGDRPLVYLVARVGALVDSGQPWVATDGNAAAQISHFSSDTGELAEMIDWPLMRAQIWRNSLDDSDRQRRRMAELLVHEQVPLDLIHLVAAYSEVHRGQAVRALGGHALTRSVTVRPDWYYGYEGR